MSTVEERVDSIVRAAIENGVQAANTSTSITITRATSFVEDLGFDSLDIMELVSAIEQSFDLEVPDDAVNRVKTVGDLYDCMNALVASDSVLP